MIDTFLTLGLMVISFILGVLTYREHIRFRWDAIMNYKDACEREAEAKQKLEPK